MSLINQRTIELFGEEDFVHFTNKTVAVIGLGGVGGIALECLARSGIKKLLIMDYDIVDITNLNRQILYIQKDIGKKKTDVAKERIASINSDIEVIIVDGYLDEITVRILDEYHLDYVIDAIDSLKAKITLQKFCIEGNIPIIVCLGMGRKFSSEDVQITTLDKTSNDPLARKYRTLLRKEKIDIRRIDVVFSPESPQKIGQKNPSSYMPVPAIAGCKLAGFVINKLKERKTK